MPHRNADGTFASGSAGYDDFEVQNVVTGIDTDSATITDAQEVFEGFNRFEPLGGLSRGEVAELVHCSVQVTASVPNSSDSATVAWVEVSSETSFDSIPHLLPITADDVSETDVITGLDARNVDITDPDPLLDHGISVSSVSLDDVNGSGSGGYAESMGYDIPFRAQFGHGPTVDRHDQLFTHIGYQSFGTAQPDFRYFERLNLVWDVQEE